MGMGFHPVTLKASKDGIECEWVFPKEWQDMFNCSEDFDPAKTERNPDYRADLDMHLSYGNARTMLQNLCLPMDDYTMLEPIETVVQACNRILSGTSLVSESMAVMFGYAQRLKHIAEEGKKMGATHISAA